VSERAAGVTDAVPFYHGTSTAVVPPDATPVTLKPPCKHNGFTVWPEEVAPRDFLYLGEYVATYFAHVRAKRDGHLPIVAEVAVAPEDLRLDPAWLKAMRDAVLRAGKAWPMPDVAQLPYTESLKDCGRIACVSEAHVTKRFVCHRPERLAQVLKESGISRFIHSWEKAETWWPELLVASKDLFANHPTDYPACRLAAGQTVLQTCFTQV
jgi:hypothetical protein